MPFLITRAIQADRVARHLFWRDRTEEARSEQRRSSKETAHVCNESQNSEGAKGAVGKGESGEEECIAVRGPSARAAQTERSPKKQKRGEANLPNSHLAVVIDGVIHNTHDPA